VLRPVENIPEAASVKTRMLTLGEKDDRAGNAMMMLLNNAHWGMPVTENPEFNSVEIWAFMNFTDDRTRSTYTQSGSRFWTVAPLSQSITTKMERSDTLALRCRVRLTRLDGKIQFKRIRG
jgi:hypothetical protein